MGWPYSVTRKDLRIDCYRGSGKGGQHRNKTDSAVRITHIVTGISAQCEDERSQHMNKRIAFRRLAAKLVPLMRAEIQKEGISMVRSNERIRTYHEPRGTVKDERLPGEVFDYDEIMDGRLDYLLEELAKKCDSKA